MQEYNQNLQKQTHYSCSIYAFLNMIKYDFWVTLKIDWILKIVIYMEKIWALLPRWAYASIIFPALLKYIKWKTWFNIKMEKTTINKINSNYWYILGFKKANRFYKSLAIDWKITKDEIDKIRDSKKWYWHFHYYKRWTIVETWWGFRYKLTLGNLIYMFEQGLYYPSCRRFYAWDEKTRKLQKKLIRLWKLNKKLISYDEFKDKYIV